MSLSKEDPIKKLRLLNGYNKVDVMTDEKKIYIYIYEANTMQLHLSFNGVNFRDDFVSELNGQLTDGCN